MNGDKAVQQLATFAGGCFWCMVKPFDELPGIVSVVSGYTGGHTVNPTYEEVGTETTGHIEAVQITYEPELFPYERLLEIYWQLIDPTDKGGQFMDRGYSYRTAIFVHSEEQREKAEASKEALKASKRFKAPIVTEILPAAPFYPAEALHQDYYKTHPLDYKMYLKGSGRGEFAEQHWNNREDRERLRKQLTGLQYEVTQNKSTEPPYQNEYWDHFREGLYVDVLSSDPLFSSADKFASGTGWPGFTRPIGGGTDPQGSGLQQRSSADGAAEQAERSLSGTSVPRRPGANEAALPHQLCRTAVYSQGGAGGKRPGTVFESV